MVKLVLVLFAALAGPSASQAPAPEARMVEAAPPQYWSPPDAPFVMMFGSPSNVNKACGAPSAGHVILACTNPARRVVLMPNPCLYQHEYYARLMCHEQAHLPRRDAPGWTHPPVR